MPPLHRILFIDAYDSFSNSIIALLKAELPVIVECIRIDDPRFVLNDEAFFAFLDGFDAVVCGPGPGHPANPEDVGLIGKLWSLPEEHLLPVLGICLGFQSLCLAFGANVGRLSEPRHGIMAMIAHSNDDIFTDAGKVVATQYHSLHVQLDGGNGEIWEPSRLWDASEHCAELMPLAWNLLNVVNGPTLMGVRHVTKPFWGVQYHPESICTNKDGHKLISKWWDLVCSWKSTHRRRKQVLPAVSPEKFEVKNDDSLVSLTSAASPTSPVHWQALKADSSLDVGDIVELLREDATSEPLLLESGVRGGKPVNSETGRFSIVALPESSSTQIQYFTNDGTLRILADGKQVDRQIPINEAFQALDEYIQSSKAVDGPSDVPFWGGLVGFISYEAGLDTIGVAPSASTVDRPDMWFVYAERSMVLDHVDEIIYVQSCRAEDADWVGGTKQRLEDLIAKPPQTSTTLNVSARLVSGPEEEEYCAKVKECQAQLRAGESYELCLTDQSVLQTTADSWTLYSQLRSRNPAPFGAYLRLTSQDTTSISIAGSSPERFLSWTREGRCQFRPIKGTVKKSPGVTRAKAEEILGSAKERAENLMIVDLIRHDLAGVEGIRGDVRVPKLMSVEEYETVFQLVSVIEGDLPSGSAALAASLPPGSMTGAPKKRSCELLKEIEGGKPRGLYSGVIGYFDVGGGGDFSVVIRTASKWDDEGDKWRIGAGGAITALSEPLAEWEEMVTKRESVLNALS